MPTHTVESVTAESDLGCLNTDSIRKCQWTPQSVITESDIWIPNTDSIKIWLISSVFTAQGQIQRVQQPKQTHLLVSPQDAGVWLQKFKDVEVRPRHSLASGLTLVPSIAMDKKWMAKKIINILYKYYIRTPDFITSLVMNAWIAYDQHPS
jgi:hypothetical protein